MIGIFVSLLSDPSKEKQFNEVYHKYINLLNKIAYGITNDEKLMEEAVNKTLAKVSLRFDKLTFDDENEPGSLKAYMCEGVKNTAYNIVREKKIRDRTFVLTDDFVMLDQEFKYEQYLEENDRQIYKEAVEFILNMPQTQRRVLTLRFVFNMELKDIADEMGLPVGTVKSRLNRGIQMLRKYFGVEK